MNASHALSLLAINNIYILHPKGLILGIARASDYYLESLTYKISD